MLAPPRSIVLDPFAGTGTTGQACVVEGRKAILIEREDEYVADIRRRIDLATRQPMMDLHPGVPA